MKEALASVRYTAQANRILNINGQVVYENENFNKRIETSSFVAGLYYVQLLQNQSVLGVSKLIIHD